MGYFLIFLAFFSLLFLCCYWFPSRNGLPTSWPIVRMLPPLLKNYPRIHYFFTEILEKSEMTFFIKGPWFSNLRLLVTADPANAQYVLSKNFGNYPKGLRFTEIFEPLGDGIFNSDGALWQYHRNMAQEFFTHPRFQQFLVKTIWEKVETGLFPLLDHATNQGLDIDLQDLFERFTFDSICTIIVGHDPKSLSIGLPIIPLSQAINDAEDAIFYRHLLPTSVWKFQRWLEVGKEKKLREALKVGDDFIFGCISRKRRERSKRSLSSMAKKVDNEMEDDIIKLYMDDRSASPKTESNTDKFLRDIFLNLLLAGRETTSVALSWFFYLLLKNPQVESKVRQELDKVIVQTKYNQGNDNDKIKDLHSSFFKNFEELNDKLVYLHAAVCEAIRLYPPLAFNSKSPMKPDILPSGHQVDPSTQIIFHMYSMGRMKSIWGEDCCEYKPERWISERGTIKQEPSYKFLAFNAGPRICVGRQMSLTQVKALAVAILSKYTIQLVEGHPVTPVPSMIIRMEHGLKVKVLSHLKINISFSCCSGG